ncbi:MAG: tRNA epoxyqueuosine(34) reductase QueG [Phycisphaeraceae bacterium]|nr:MAG: tRNA epoxyqueuosine(34) reductase QueG [Phycisphaeraceae bacterium]
MARSVDEIGREVVGRCLALGFASAGVCEALPIEHAGAFRDWLDAGKHGSMDWITEHLEHRLDPRGLLRGCRGMIVVGDVYASRGEADGSPGTGGGGPEGVGAVGRVARYARGRDYHRVVKDRLRRLTRGLAADYPGERFRSMVDVMPIHEREAARRAGVGWVGKHTLVIHPRLGSWMVLGCVLTTMELRSPGGVRDHCGTCTRCIDACPTGAITPYSVDAGRCISYLTIERRGEIPEGFHAAMGEWVFGCDVCQEVCPHNSPRDADPWPVRPEYRRGAGAIPLLDVLGWDPARFDREFIGTAVRRVSVSMLKRNALIAGTNLVLRGASEGAGVSRSVWAAGVGAIAGDDAEDPMVRATARSCLARLGPAGQGGGA